MPDPALIIYDGDCIFCQNYVRLVRLRETLGKVELVDARSQDPRVRKYQREGYNLNEGMLFVWNGRIYHGSDAVHVLAGLSTKPAGSTSSTASSSPAGRHPASYIPSLR